MERTDTGDATPRGPTLPPANADEELGPRQDFKESAELVIESGERAQLSPEVLGATATGSPAPPPRMNREAKLVLAAAFAASGFLVAAAVLHFLQGRVPAGTPTFLLAGTAACLAYVGVVFEQATWPRTITGGDFERRAHVHKLTQLSLSVAFGCFLAILAVVELAALLVGAGAFDLNEASFFFAVNYPLFLVLVLAALTGAVFVRTRQPALRPSKEEGAIRGKLAKAKRPNLIATLAFLQFAVLVAIGFSPINEFVHVKARQATYLATLAFLVLLVQLPFDLRLPNLVAVVREEIRRSRKLDRSTAEKMQKSAVRNYVLALVFVLLSVIFLAVLATGVLPVEETQAADLILLVYVTLGLAMLVVLGMRFVQHRNVEQRLGRAKKGQVIAKRRYTKEEINKMVILGVGGTFALVFAVLAVVVQLGKIPAIDRQYTTDLFIFALLAGLGPYGWYYNREMKRIRNIDEKFPDFLRDLAEGQRAGMTLPRALLTASKGTYGALTPEIQKMASQVEWGVPFTEAFQRLSHRVKTPLIERTVSLVIEASNAGGNVVDVLSAASDDAREIKNILFERGAQMGIYAMIIYIAFFVFLVVIGVLNAQFIPELAKATSQVAGSKLGGISFEVLDVQAYQLLFFHAAVIQGLGGGFVAGVMTQGHPMAGLKHGFILTLVAYVAFRFVML